MTFALYTHTDEKEAKMKQLRKNRNDASSTEIDYHVRNSKPDGTTVNPGQFRAESVDRKARNYIGEPLFSTPESQRNMNLLSAAIEYTGSTVVVTNRNGEIEFVNPAFSKITGYTRQEAIGKKTSILKSDFYSASYYAKLWDTILSGNVWRGEFYNRRKDGRFYWESAIISPIIDTYSGEITHFIAIKEDITEKKQNIDLLRKSEEQLRVINITKDKFFSIIGHDLMNPFNALLGLSRLLCESLANENMDESVEYASIIQQSAEKVLNLLQSLLLWARTQNGMIKYAPERVRIEDLVSDSMSILQPVAQKKGISLHFFSEHNISAEFDYNMISSVIRNLVTNSIKFTKKGGIIAVKSYMKSDSLFFVCSDSGVGIGQEQLDDLFKLDKTFSSKGTDNEPGSGLGLVICKEFIEMHGGEIWAESMVDKGSTFYFKIPVAR